MGLSYSNSVAFTTSATLRTCVQVPAHTRGELQRLVLVKTSGTIVGGSISLYDRRGACLGQTDLNVTQAGVVSSVADSGGDALVTTAAVHNVEPGTQIEFKGDLATTYPGLHTVTSVVSDTALLLGTAFASNAAGSWQTAPWIPTLHPDNHLVLIEAVSASGSVRLFDLERAYMNRDNQTEKDRRPTAALWLEYTPTGGSGVANFELAITSSADDI